MSLRSALERGVAVGGLWGFVEVVFVYLTGSAPASDAVLILLAPLGVLVLYQVAVLAVSRLRPHSVFDLLAAAGVLLPPVLLFLRGRGQRAPLSLLAGLTPCLLALLYVLRDRRKRADGEWLTPGRIVAILGLCFVAAVAFSLRTSRHSSLSPDTILTAALWCGAMALAGALSVAVAKRRAGLAFLATVVAAAFTVAWTRASEPPRFSGKPVRSSTARAPAGSPNVLLIVLDTVRADRLDLYGHTRPTFAHTGRYLRDGLVFDRAVSTKEDHSRTRMYQESAHRERYREKALSG